MIAVRAIDSKDDTEADQGSVLHYEIRAIVRECVEEGGGEKEGFAILCERRREDPLLNTAWIAYADHVAWLKTCQENRHLVNRSIRQNGSSPGNAAASGAYSAAGLLMLKRKTMEAWLDMELSGGRVLGDLSRDGLKEEGAMRLKSARTQYTMGRYFMVIADVLPNGKRVRDHFTNEALGALYYKALNAAP